MGGNHQPEIVWDLGTAYDLFISQAVIHKPEYFGLRASWAAGVRSRVPAEERKVLEDASLIINAPLPWIHSLPEPKDSSTALWVLSQIPPAERLPAIYFCCGELGEVNQMLKEIAARRSWDEADLEALRTAFRSKEHGLNQKELVRVVDWWSRPDEFGELYLAALRTYYQEFFAEEEQRILPALKSALERAQELANQLEFINLIEDLSQGLHFPGLADLSQLILTPSYWCTPLVLFEDFGEKRMVMTFGGRPAEASLIPGEAVPDALLRALKALADPTRLRIMRYLTEEPLTPAQLSRLLRLRPPTVTHHLNELRLAGLVHVILEEGSEKRYTVRTEMLKNTFINFEDYLALGERQFEGGL
jgi:DNA-binding transcriptional ArsR family regulator